MKFPYLLARFVILGFCAAPVPATAQSAAALKPLIVRYGECQKQAAAAGLSPQTAEYQAFIKSCYPSPSETRKLDQAGALRLLLVISIIAYWAGVAWLGAKEAESRRHRIFWIAVATIPIVNLLPLIIWRQAGRTRGLPQ